MPGPRCQPPGLICYQNILTSQLITDMTGGVMIARASASSDQGNMQTNYLSVQAGQGSGSGKIVDHSEPSVQLSHN